MVIGCHLLGLAAARLSYIPLLAFIVLLWVIFFLESFEGKPWNQPLFAVTAYAGGDAGVLCPDFEFCGIACKPSGQMSEESVIGKVFDLHLVPPFISKDCFIA